MKWIADGRGAIGILLGGTFESRACIKISKAFEVSGIYTYWSTDGGIRPHFLSI